MKKRSEIGDRIKVLRESLSKSQVKFARLLKVSPPTVSRWEAGKVIPPTHVSSTLESGVRKLRLVLGARGH